MEQKTPVLEMDHISKSFPGVKALDGVSLTVCPGTVHALMGENGAGKSTLMKCAFGLYHPDEGAIKISGEQVHFVDARDAMDKGISMIHQELHPIRTRNIMENIWVGRVPYKKLGPVKWVDEKKMYEDTQALFKDLEVNLDPRTMVQELNASNCQLIEIARAVSYGAKVIIMDEPTSSLTSVEAELLFKIIAKLTAQGVAIIYISHKMDEILRISDTVTVMRDGQLVGTWPASELTQQILVSKMVGREMSNQFPPQGPHPQRRGHAGGQAPHLRQRPVLQGRELLRPPGGDFRHRRAGGRTADGAYGVHLRSAAHRLRRDPLQGPEGFYPLCPGRHPAGHGPAHRGAPGHGHHPHALHHRQHGPGQPDRPHPAVHRREPLPQQ